MPTYEYRCPKCGNITEVATSVKNRDISPPCKQCGAKTTRIQSRVGGLIFKGSGFYKTDYNKDPKAKEG